MKVTIITATYNSDVYLKTCIESVLNQSYEDIEYIIIDNCSTDNTLDIAKSYSGISRIVSEPDSGIFDAMNKGIRLSSGDIIGFLHADDFYADNTVIAKIVDTFTANNSDSVYGDLQYVNRNNTDKIIRNWRAGNYNPKKFLKGWMPPHPTFFVKKQCYIKYGLFSADYKIASDYELMLRFLYKNKISTAYLKQVMVKMRVGGKSNKSFSNIILKSKEDLKIIRLMNIGAYFTLIRKNLQKIKQFF